MCCFCTIYSHNKDICVVIPGQLSRKTANGSRFGSASNFRKSGIQAEWRRVTGGRIMGHLLPVRLRSQLAGVLAGCGRRAPTLDYRIMKRRPADDDIGSSAPPKFQTTAASRLADREGLRVTGKRSAFLAQHWCPAQRRAKCGSAFHR